MQPSVGALHQVRILVLLVVGLVLVADVAFAPLHPADHGEGQAAVLGQGHGYGAPQAGPCALAAHILGDAGGVVGDGNAAGLGADGADGRIVVGQHRGLGLGPAVAPVKGLAAIDEVRLPAAHEGNQVSIVQLHHGGMNSAIGLGHHDHPPSFALIVGDAEGGGVAGKAVHRVGANPVAVDPASVFQHLNGLPGEGALLGEDGLVVAPGLAAVEGLLAAHLSGVLHIVLAGDAAQLGGVHTPDGAVGAKEQGRVLLRTGGVARDIHRLLPLVRPLGQAGADDVDIGVALKGAGKPAAQQVAVRQLHHSGAMAGAPGAGGDDGFHGAHLRVVVDLTIHGQPGQCRIVHSFLLHIVLCVYPLYSATMFFS